MPTDSGFLLLFNQCATRINSLIEIYCEIDDWSGLLILMGWETVVGDRMGRFHAAI